MKKIIPSGIKQKLFSILAVVSLLIFAIGALALYGIQRISSQSNIITDREVPLVRSVQEALEAVFIAERSWKKVFEIEDFAKLNEIRDQEAIFRKSIIRFDIFISAITWGSESAAFARSSAGLTLAEWKRAGLKGIIIVEQASPAQAQRAGQTNIYFGGFSNNGQKSISYYKKALRLQSLGQTEEAEKVTRESKEFRERAEKFFTLTVGTLSKMTESSNAKTAITVENIKQVQRDMFLFVLFISLAGFVLALLISSIFTEHVIARPLSNLLQAVRKISGGDLSKKVTITSKDEIGQLAISFNTMTVKLQRYYKNLEYEKNKLSHITQNMEVGAILLDKQGEIIFLNRKAKEILGLTDDSEEDILERFFTLFSTFNVKMHLRRCIEGEPSRISRAKVDDKIFEIFFRNLVDHNDRQESHEKDIFGHLIWIHDITTSKLLEQQIKKRAQELELNVVKLEKTKIAIQNLLEDLAEEKKKVEQRVMVRTAELEQEKSKLNQITQNMTTGALLLDGQGEVIFVNKEASKILGLKDDDNKSALKKLYRTFENAPIGEHVKKCLLGEQTKIPEIQVGDKIFEILFRCLSENTEHATHFFGYLIWIQDITEEKLIQRSRSELVAVASHQLRTPLTVTKGNTEMLLDETFGPLNSEQQKLITQTAQANERLIRLVNNMLDLTKMEKGKLEMILEQVHIEEILESVVTDLRFYAKKHVALVQYTKPDKQVPAVMADRTRLHQVFQNLIENAIRYCAPSQGKTCSVKISVDISDTQVTVHVSDTGIGIPQQEQSKIFERFYRASNAVRHAASGSGLGLSTVKSIIEQLGGKVWFESKENKGTTFHLMLPIVKT